MAYKFACSKVGFSCPFEAEGKTEDELMAKIKKHGKEAHGMTEAQINDPAMSRKVKAAIQKT